MPNVLNFMCLLHHTKNRRSSHKSASKTQDSCQEPGGTLKHFDVLSSSFKADAPLYDLSMFTLSLAMRKMQTWKWKYVWGQSVGFLQSHRFCWGSPEVSGLYSISLIGLSQVDIHGNTSKNLFLSCVLMIALQLLNSLPFCSTPVFLPWIRESIVLQYIECLINIGNFFKAWWRQEKSDFSQLCVKRRLEAVRQDFESCFQSKGFYLQGQSHHQCQHKRSRDFNIVNHQHYRTNLVAMICTYWCLHYHPLVHTKRKYFLQQIKVRKPSKYNAQTDKCVTSCAKKLKTTKISQRCR